MNSEISTNKIDTISEFTKSFERSIISQSEIQRATLNFQTISSSEHMKFNALKEANNIGESIYNTAIEESESIRRSLEKTS